jgi:hypothetical protein
MLRLLAVYGLFCTKLVQATITVDETGEIFSSNQDGHYGPLLWKGYTYPGRLQRIDTNQALCPPPNDGRNNTATKHRLVIPSDGWPVALLAREGSCSLAEKLQYIQDSVTPAALVKYLIVDDSRGEHFMIEDGNDASSTSGRSTSVHAELAKLEALAADQDDVSNKRDESIPIHVLHVSFRTEFKLLDYVLHQTETTQADGGPRLTLDRRLHANHLSDNMALAIAALTMLGACLCSLGLLVHGNRSGWWEPPPPPPGPPRSRRRRLRREQVQAWLPVYRFTGDELELIDKVNTTTTDEGEEDLAHVPPPVPPNAVDLDCCAICLDDYEEGDRLRCIAPCQHVFHSKCIGKWLVERSSTCPLCKHDLYDSDDELDEEDEENHNAAQQQAEGANAGIQQITVEPPTLRNTADGGGEGLLWGWRRRLWRTVTSDDEVDDDDDEAEPMLSLLEDPQTEVGNGSDEQAVTTDIEEPRLPPRSHRRRWWQRWSVRSSPSAALTEPLLDLAEEEEAPAAPDDEETGVAPLEMGSEPVIDPPDVQAHQASISTSD